MVTIRLPPGCKRYRRLLKEHKVEYHLVGGYAAGYFGIRRPDLTKPGMIALKNENKARKWTREFQEGAF
jgi:hypothetical protein